MRYALRCAVAVVLSLQASRASHAATPLESLRISTDTAVALGAVTLDDEDIADDDLAGSVTPVPLASFPAAADIDAYHRLPSGHVLLSFDTTVQLPGPLTAEPFDVVRFDGASFTFAFQGRSVGLPAGADVDAVASRGGSLLLSFDTTVDLGTLWADDEDLVLYDGVSFAPFFDGSAAGVDPALDLDAADYLECNGHLLLSFDGSGAVGGVPFDDEDLLEHDGVSTWELAWDPRAEHSGWGAADLDAVQGTVDLGPGPAAVFPATVRAAADKTTYGWTTPSAFRAVRGSFDASGDIAAYAVEMTWEGNGTSLSDPALPAVGAGFWYLVKPGGCVLTSWQSSLGREPGRDAILP